MKYGMFVFFMDVFCFALYRKLYPYHSSQMECSVTAVINREENDFPTLVQTINKTILLNSLWFVIKKYHNFMAVKIFADKIVKAIP